MAKNQKGAILILFAMVALLLIGFAALIVDTGINESTRTEVQQASQNAALGAISAYLGYLKTPAATPNYLAASQHARNSAIQILETNSYMGQIFRKDPGIRSFNLGDGTNFTGANGSIEFGYYYWLKPAAVDSNPCNDHYPCFVPHGTSAPANAVRISSSLGANPLRAVFSRILGYDYFNIQTSTIATLIPQNYAFLVDLSTSVTGRNHPVIGEKYCDFPNAEKFEPLQCSPTGRCMSDIDWSKYPACWRTGSAAHFVYELRGSGADGYTAPAGCSDFAPATGCACLFAADTADEDHPDYCVEDFYPNYWAGRTYRETLRGDTYDPDYYKGQPLTSGVPSESITPDPMLFTDYGWVNNDPRIHYRNDYKLFSIDFGRDLILGDSSSQAVRRTLAVDFGNSTGSNDFYPNYVEGSGPEPLFSLFSAAHDAMDFIVARAVAADQFLFAGFDTSVLRKRVSCSDGTASETCASKFVGINDESFSQFQNAINIKNSAQRRNVIAGHFLNLGLFPMIRNTDGQMILWDTFDELTRLENFSQAKNLVFLFTDGLFNCGLPTSWNGDPIGFPAEYLAARQCGGVEKDKDGNDVVIGRGVKVLKTIQQIAGATERSPANKSLVEIFREKKIAVSMILLGEGIGGHNLVRKSRLDPTKCMDLAEAINQGDDWVNWGKRDYLCTEEDKSSDCNDLTGYINSNRLNGDYRKMEQGLGDFYLPNYLYSALVAPTKGAWIPIMKPLYVGGSSTGLDFESQLTTACAALPAGGDLLEDFTLPSNGIQVTDDKGRLLFHPKGWEVSEQIQKEVERVLAGGYMLVEPPRD